MRSIKIRDLVDTASKDFELAKERRSLRDYVTATLLYNKAVEKILRALFISRVKKSPPKNVSIDYLAQRTGLPDEISMYIDSVEKSDELEKPVDLTELDGYDEELTSSGAQAERQAFFLDGLTKRLLDYVNAYQKI